MASKWQERRERLRALFAGDICIQPGSVHDPISARIAFDLGFEAGIFAGSTASLTVLGSPDNITLTLTEFAEQAHRICRAAPLPLFVDADHGYGNALNVMRTIEELETAGVAGLSIEDTLLPTAFGAAQTQLTSIAEGVGKIRAALAARTDTAMMIAARTSAPMINGLDDTLERVKAYAAEGPDAIFLIGLKSPEDLGAVQAVTSLPIIIGGGGATAAPLDVLAGAGARMVLRGHLPIQAATQAVYVTLKAIREGAVGKDISGLASPELVASVMREDDYARWVAAFLRSDE